MPRFTDTIAALATPVGTSAIAVVRASGPDTLKIAVQLFGDTPPPRTTRRADYQNASGEVLDDVLYVFFQGPHSYTGEDSLEISCHGNPLIAQKLLEDLFTRGCRPAEPGEFSQRAFINGRMDLSQAEAVMDLIHARSDRALTAANQQLRGSLSRKMAALVDALLMVLARVEAYIDFPDEDLPPEDRQIVVNEVERLSRGTERLLATSHYGDLLRDGIKTVIVGSPNVGKSSLLNRLVGHERALVSPEAGTTRDFIEERLRMGSHLLRLIDTAGLNAFPTPIESLGIQKTIERASEADLFLWVVDGSDLRESPALPTAFADKMNSANSLLLLNKSDLAASTSFPAQMSSIPAIRISAHTGAGLPELTAAITRIAESFRGHTGTEIVAINARHAHALGLAKQSLQAAADNLLAAGPVELLASDLRSVLSAYGEISGGVDNERMLDALFATFCIGK
jgi:tRNA modification GTPase